VSGEIWFGVGVVVGVVIVDVSFVAVVLVFVVTTDGFVSLITDVKRVSHVVSISFVLVSFVSVNNVVGEMLERIVPNAGFVIAVVVDAVEEETGGAHIVVSVVVVALLGRAVGTRTDCPIFISLVVCKF
jgi:hypothetical protein